MPIEIIVIPGSVFLAATLAAKLIECSGDVLYGPYIQGRKHPFAELRDQLAELIESIGLRESFGRLALKFAGVSYFASAIIG